MYINIIKVIGTASVFWVSPYFAYAQYFPDENDSSLKGVTSFDARFTIASWLDPSTDQGRFRENGQRAFELALRRDGVVVEGSAPNYLYCEISIADSDSGLVFYHWDVEYYIYNSNGIHILAWTTGGIVTIGSSNFSAEVASDSCADSFANVWLAQNPPGN